MIDFRKIILSIPVLLVSIFSQGQILTTIAGNGLTTYGGDGVAATITPIFNPTGVVVDAAGNIYIADYYNFRVRKVDPLGTITSIAGNGTFDTSGNGGLSISAGMGYPAGVALDNNGNLYIADFGNHNVRKITPTGIISLFAGGGISSSLGDGGPATAAYLDGPTGVAADTAGNVYIADEGGDRIRKVDKSGTISTFAGTGFAGYSGDGAAATAATFRNPFGVATDIAGNVFIADSYNSCIRKISLSGKISTVAGKGFLGGFSGDGGAATAAQMSAPYGVVIDTDGTMYISDTANRIREVTPAGKIITIAGTGISGYNGDGAATATKLNSPAGIALDAAGNIYVADEMNNRIRMITKDKTGIPSPVFVTAHSLAAYPNPNNGSFSIKVSSGINEEAKIIITNSSGQKVRELTITTNKETELCLHVPDGIYCISATTKSGRITSEIIVE